MKSGQNLNFLLVPSPFLFRVCPKSSFLPLSIQKQFLCSPNHQFLYGQSITGRISDVPCTMIFSPSPESKNPMIGMPLWLPDLVIKFMVRLDM